MLTILVLVLLLITYGCKESAEKFPGGGQRKKTEK